VTKSEIERESGQTTDRPDRCRMSFCSCVVLLLTGLLSYPCICDKVPIEAWGGQRLYTIWQSGKVDITGC